MTVYKGYMRIAKKNTGLFLLYLAIFFAITLLFQYLNSDSNMKGYQKESLPIAVVDEDGGELADALKQYLGQFHQIIEVENNTSVLQEMLFYGDAKYIVRIPGEFYKEFLLKGKKLAVTQVPGSYTAYYVDQQLNSFLNNVRVYAAAGFTEEETAKAAANAAEVNVELMDVSGNAGKTPDYIMYFRYMPYLALGALGYMIGNMISSMHRGDLKKRMLASAIPQRRQSIEGLLACGTVALMLWLIVVAAAFIFYGKELLESSGLPYYLLNTLALQSVVISVAYLIGSLSRSIESLNGMVNVASLGMCFLGGAFVPLELMSRGVRKAAQFLPVYWYETANDMLGEFGIEAVKTEVLQAIGIQLVFAAVFVCVTLAVAKLRKVE